MDDDDIDTPPSPRPRERKTAYESLPLVLLESVIGRDGVTEIGMREQYCLVIEAPAADWVTPVYRTLRSLGRWWFAHGKSAPNRSRFSPDDSDERTVAALTQGGRVFGVSQSPTQLLPTSMLTSADRYVRLPLPDGAVIRKVIRQVTGRSPGKLPDDICSGLRFDEIAGCIRAGSSAPDCVTRLERAVQAKRKVETFDQVPDVADLHGYGAAKDWALDLISDLAAWRRSEIQFEAISSRAVLASNPGLGKSTFARSLAKSAGLPLVSTSVAAWFASSPGYLDSIIKQIDEVFATARASAPAILFLDEIDAVPNRATLRGRGADWWTPVITHLLTTLDGTNNASTANLVIIGATNHPEKLDTALIRPGRLSRVIEIGPPDASALAGIFRQHLGTDLAGADLTDAGRLAFGNLGTGAMAVEWVKSARRAAREAKRPMVMTDLLLAIAPEDRRPEKQRRRTAVHEVGHAVVGHLSGDTPVGISMIEGRRNDGFTIFDRNDYLETRGDIERLVTELLAGRAAEEVLLGEPGTGAGIAPHSDLARATALVGAMHMGAGLGDQMLFRAGGDDVLAALSLDSVAATQVEADLRRLYARALEIIRANLPLVEALAGELLSRRYVDRSRFLELVSEMGKELGHG